MHTYVGMYSTENRRYHYTKHTVLFKICETLIVDLLKTLWIFGETAKLRGKRDASIIRPAKHLFVECNVRYLGIILARITM